MSTVIHGVAQQTDVETRRNPRDVNIRAHCILLHPPCQGNLHEQRSSPVSNISSTRCSWPRHIFATKQNAQHHFGRTSSLFFGFRFFSILPRLFTGTGQSEQCEARTERRSYIDQQAHVSTSGKKKKTARSRISRGKERCLCFSCAACASFSVSLSFSFYLYLYFYLPFVSRVSCFSLSLSLSCAEQQNRGETRNERPRFVNANSSPGFRDETRPSTSRWTTNEKSEGERERERERQTGRGGRERERVRAREKRRRVSDVTLKCLTRLWTSTGGDAAGVKKRREGVAALDVSRSIND